MKRTLSIILVLIMTMTLLVGCGSTTTQTPTPETSGSESTGPSRDTVNLSINATWTTCDPHATSYVQDRVILWQMYNGLMHYNELTGTADFDLATSYDVSEDGMTYTFKLRDDVYFHNGDKMNVSDVAFSIMRATDPNMAISQYGTNIVSATAIDGTTVEVQLACAYAPFITNCCQLFILSEREVTEQGDKFGVEISTAGTGPYKLTYLDNDAKISLEAFDKYYKGEASIKYVNFYPITDSAAGLISFESGDIDWYNCGVMDAQRIEIEGKFNVEFMAVNHMTFMAINPNSSNKALQNEKVRKAIAYAINKEELNMAAFEGLGQTADYLENPDWNIGAPKGDVVYNYDPEMAKQLLAEAGYPDGVDVGNILCFKGSHFETCATVIQQELEAVGIHAKLEWNEQATTLDRGKKKDYDIFVTGGNCSGDYDNLRKRFYSPLSTTYVDYTTTEYDANYLDTRMDEAAGCIDPAKRLEITKEVNDYLMNTATYLPLLHKAVAFVWNKDLNVVNRPVNPIIYDWSWN